jgi:hypothetical protein
MAEKKPKQPGPSPEKQMPSNVIPLKPVKCLEEDCKKSPARAGFCDMHYEWFKFGLITIDGYKAKDYDKKYQIYLRHKQKVAA